MTRRMTANEKETLRYTRSAHDCGHGGGLYRSRQGKCQPVERCRLFQLRKADYSIQRQDRQCDFDGRGLYVCEQ